MSTGSTKLEFHSGVARFDAMGNLFVHLRHSTDDPLPVLLGDGSGAEAPPRERRALVKGQGSTSGARAAFPTTNDLPRGTLVVAVQGWDNLVLRDDGALEVEVTEAAELPPWFQAGQSHTFRRDDGPLRLWAKSALPSGVSRSGAAVSEAPKPIQTAARPKETRPAPTPVAAATPEPDREAPAPKRPTPPPFEPEQARRADGQSRLAGCTGLLVLGALGVATLALLLG